jgi:hypothetical protein
MSGGNNSEATAAAASYCPPLRRPNLRGARRTDNRKDSQAPPDLGFRCGAQQQANCSLSLNPALNEQARTGPLGLIERFCRSFQITQSELASPRADIPAELA